MSNADNTMAGTPALRWQIVIALLLAALLPLALAGFGAWLVFGRLIERQSLEALDTLVAAQAQVIETDLAARTRLLQALADANDCIQVCGGNRLTLMLEDLNHSGSWTFQDLRVIGGNGEELAVSRADRTGNVDYRKTEWFQKTLKQGAYVSDVFLESGRPLCALAVRTRDADDTWVLCGTVDPAHFSALLSGSVLFSASTAVIINAAGILQTGSTQGSLLDSLYDLSRITRGGDADNHRVSIDDTTFVVATEWINNDRWLLIALEKLDIVKAPVNQAIVKGAQVVFVAVVILILTTVVATSRLTSRIDKANAQREEMSRAFMRSARLASIGELATGLSHEINNPLAVISAELTNLSDFTREFPAEEPQRSRLMLSVDRCRRQVQRCAGITRKMLQFGRQREATPEITEIAPRLQEILALFDQQARVQSITLHLEIDENVPSILVDPIEFEQVIVNLINNAIDALPHGGDIWIRSTASKERLNIEVTDNGIGISPEQIERIFEPFYTTKPVGQGTGLGLAVCYGLVRSWRGRICAVSEQGRGTTLHIDVPIASEERAPAKT